MSSLLESLHIAVQGLVANKVRAALTMLGIIIGVAAVTTVVSVGNGFGGYISGQFEGLGPNVLFVFSDPEASDSPQPLTTGDGEALADSLALPGVEAVASVYQQSVRASYGGEEATTSASGVTPEYQTVRNFEVAVGRFIGQEEVDHRTRVVLLGHTVAQELFPGNAYPIGETIRLNDVAFEVIGVLVEKGAAGPINNDDVVLIPLSTAQTRLFNAETVRGDYVVSVINVQSRSEDEMASVMAGITDILRRRHRIEPGESDDFTVDSQAELLDMVGNILGMMTVVVGAIGAISLLVGGVGIMNIMLVSVTERTREIGLRKAIGAGRNDILLQFLIEAMALSLTGGLVGLALGVVGSRFIGPALDLQVTVAAGTMLLAAGFSAAVGLFFGIYPAVRAASLNPIDALCYE